MVSETDSTVHTLSILMQQFNKRKAAFDGDKEILNSFDPGLKRMVLTILSILANQICSECNTYTITEVSTLSGEQIITQANKVIAYVRKNILQDQQDPEKQPKVILTVAYFGVLEIFGYELRWRGKILRDIKSVIEQPKQAVTTSGPHPDNDDYVVVNRNEIPPTEAF